MDTTTHSFILRLTRMDPSQWTAWEMFCSRDLQPEAIMSVAGAAYFVYLGEGDQKQIWPGGRRGKTGSGWNTPRIYEEFLVTIFYINYREGHGGVYFHFMPAY